MNVVALRLWLAASLVGASCLVFCVSNDFASGQFACTPGPNAACPPGLVCADDGRCRTSALVEAGAGADAAGSGFCAAQHHDLCLDFDDGGYAGWLPNGTGLSIDDDASTSPPSSLLVALPESGEPSATLRAGLPAAARVVCRFAILPEALDDSAVAPDTIILRLSTQAGYDLTFNVDAHDGKALLAEYGTSSGTQVPADRLPMPPLGAWTVVSLDANLAADGGTASVSVGGVVTSGIALYGKASVFSSVEIGAAMSNLVAKPTRLRIDDVACDHLPP
jgi:hypothetical protein